MPKPPEGFERFFLKLKGSHKVFLNPRRAIRFYSAWQGIRVLVFTVSVGNVGLCVGFELRA